MVENMAPVDLQAQWANTGKISGFAGPIMFREATSQAAEDKAGNEGKQVLGKHEQTLSIGLK
jgi:hypothetical protein